uniref:Uncharacterized protein n=1 Tax=Molossus molossus TaxID=27622 RepID=A0A7J8IA88_MOLMO|nr:hypothetical protein HJG59_010686 [Molossus molossus]
MEGTRQLLPFLWRTGSLGLCGVQYRVAPGHPPSHRRLGDRSTLPWLKSLQWDLHLHVNNPLAFPLFSPPLPTSFLHPLQPHPWLCGHRMVDLGRDLRDGSVAQRDQRTARGHLLANGTTLERSWTLSVCGS